MYLSGNDFQNIPEFVAALDKNKIKSARLNEAAAATSNSASAATTSSSASSILTTGIILLRAVL